MPKPPTSAPQLNLKPNHAPVKKYYDALKNFRELGVGHEGAVRDAFQDLLKKCASQFGWTLVPEASAKGKDGNRVQLDGEIRDQFNIPRGHWEAKDERDDLKVEVKKKLEKGYPRKNIVFQAPDRAILLQNGLQVRDADLTDPDQLVDALRTFFGYREPDIEEFDQAVGEFKERIPELATSLLAVIEKERKTNRRFVEAFEAFANLCRQSINPNLSNQAVEEMLIQHLLTERIFRNVFDNPDFTRRNVIAVEIEKVIDALTSKSFDRGQFLSQFDRFYKAIEDAARAVEDFAEKQRFLNTVYEKFFQGFSVKVADTHGIVYTPDAIVNFMVHSVEEILEKQFRRTLSDRDVHVLDPFVGTGNFIVHIMREIKKTALELKYKNELHCNEVMLLPYYIASMNIEHEYFERVGTYESFEGICLVDTFDIRRQAAAFAEENLRRIERQNASPIFVAIGNPPYNAWQLDENDNNKNREYPELAERVRETYMQSSRATNMNALADPYIKAFRWASDRVGAEGIVALVTNSAYIDSHAADGMRKHLMAEFDEIYLVDLGGNVRKNPKLSGTTHNVFGIKVGVSIAILVRRNVPRQQRASSIRHCRTGEFWTRSQKCAWLDKVSSLKGIEWNTLVPDANGNWIVTAHADEFQSFLPLASLFAMSSNGLKSNRDAWVYGFSRQAVADKTKRTLDVFESELLRWDRRPDKKVMLDDFLTQDSGQISWADSLKQRLERGEHIEFNDSRLRKALYRPYSVRWLYYDAAMNERRYQLPSIFPDGISRQDNVVIWAKTGGDWPFFSLATDLVPDQLPQGGSQCFPLYTYGADGAEPRENVTDWAVEQFCANYKGRKVGKSDIFHYVYAVLHHPDYRARYSADLGRELPRIPFAPQFWPFADAGKRLADLHVNYEKQPEYPLEKIEKSGEKLDWRVQKMRLSKDKTTLYYNDFLALKGIPPETYEYRLGNRSALEWIIDQYQVSTDKRSGITNDPNRDDDSQYIVRLIGQVVTVSLETVRIVKGLPDLGLSNEEAEPASA
jgi:predicted helicase